MHKWDAQIRQFVNTNLRDQIPNHAGVASRLALYYWFGQ